MSDSSIPVGGVVISYLLLFILKGLWGDKIYYCWLRKKARLNIEPPNKNCGYFGLVGFNALNVLLFALFLYPVGLAKAVINEMPWYDILLTLSLSLGVTFLAGHFVFKMYQDVKVILAARKAKKPEEV